MIEECDVPSKNQYTRLQVGNHNNKKRATHQSSLDMDVSPPQPRARASLRVFTARQRTGTQESMEDCALTLSLRGMNSGADKPTSDRSPHLRNPPETERAARDPGSRVPPGPPPLMNGAGGMMVHGTCWLGQKATLRSLRRGLGRQASGQRPSCGPWWACVPTQRSVLNNLLTLLCPPIGKQRSTELVLSMVSAE